MCRSCVKEQGHRQWFRSKLPCHKVVIQISFFGDGLVEQVKIVSCCSQKKGRPKKDWAVIAMLHVTVGWMARLYALLNVSKNEPLFDASH